MQLSAADRKTLVAARRIIHRHLRENWIGSLCFFDKRLRPMRHTLEPWAERPVRHIERTLKALDKLLGR